MEPHQGEFAKLIGVSQGKQSLYERGERELRASYLAELDRAGLDVLYIITGRRAAGPQLSALETAMVGALAAVSREDGEALLQIARSLGGRANAGASIGTSASSTALHEGATDFRSESGSE